MIQDILDYTSQMLPLGLAALIIFLLLQPIRKKRLNQMNLISSGGRESALSLFVIFCAGLASLTLFPANFWSGAVYYLFRPNTWSALIHGWDPLSCYPSWEETVARAAYLPDMLTPFQEIGRALRARSYWLLFMLVGNIVMFMPIGFFPALLWRNWKWWKALLTGLCTSAAIELIQFFIGRSTDIDDVILNTTGTIAGFWIFCLIRVFFPTLIEGFQCHTRGGYYYG